MVPTNCCYAFWVVCFYANFAISVGFSLQSTRLSFSGTLPSRRLQSGLTVGKSSSTNEETCVPFSTSYLAQHNGTLIFPAYEELMRLKPGECAVSETFTVSTVKGKFDFCVKLYPKGGGHNSPRSVFTGGPKSGFGMAYRTLPILGNVPQEKVGVYLQFLPADSTQTIDASFALRLLGRQLRGPRFDVEWRAGMRFVALEKTNLGEGMANDFGAHLMETPLLASFLGMNYASENDGEYETERHANQPVKLRVELLIHEPLTDAVLERTNTNKQSTPGGWLTDVRGTKDDFHHHQTVRVGRVIVPVLKKLSQRPGMFAQGVYPGVEYRILRIVDPTTQEDLFYSRSGVDYELKPIYPLVPQLERAWPVRVNEAEIPKMLTPSMYNALSAVGSLLTAATGLMAAFLVSQAVSIFVIPSRSMDPTLLVGDVLLVEKVTPRLFFSGTGSVGEVVLFHPTDQLKEIVAASGGRLDDRDLFVKRIAAEPGNSFTVDKSGYVKINGESPHERRDLCEAEPSRLIEKYIHPVPADNENSLVQPGQVVVLGDCSSVSIDSRVWGPLPAKNIVGRPIVRLWPLSRFGPIKKLELDWDS